MERSRKARVYSHAMQSLHALLIGCLAATTAGAAHPAKPAFELDHVILVVAPGAPERAALERAGLRIAPTVNHHDGQGTASVTIEFENAFLELLWPDASVPVSPDREEAARKFRQKSA